jgi:DNA-binding MarR family transcriptional regulator
MEKDINQFIFITLSLKRFFMCQQPGGLSIEDRAATMLQFEALRSIQHDQKTTMGKLSSDLEVSLSSGTQLVERLVKLNLVKRESDKKDRRIIHLFLTALGKKELKKMEKKMQTRFQEIFSKVPKKDFKELIRIHKNLLDSLEKDSRK